MTGSILRTRVRKIVRRLVPREHRRLSRSGFRVGVAERISQLNPELWDETTRSSSLFLSRRYLETLDRHRPDNVEPRYALITDGDVPIAALCCQIVTLDAARVGRRKKSPQVLARLVQPTLSRLSKSLRERVLICGNLLTWGQHAVAIAEAGAPDIPRAWLAVVEALYRIRRAERLAGGADLTLIKDLLPGDLASPDLEPVGFRRVATEPNMVLEIGPNWRSHDDYLAALDAKYRKTARQILKDVSDRGLVVEPLRDLGPVAERLHALYLSVQENNTLRPVTAPVGYLSALAQALGDEARCTVVRDQNDVLGFVITLKDGETAVGYHIGFDREAAKAAPVYLRLLHAVVADAIALGCRRLSLGRTALEPKARLGATPEAMEVWVKHRTGGVNFLLGRLLALAKPAAAPQRNPFKKVS